MSEEEKVVLTFSKHLKTLRRQNKLTQEELSELADISYKNLQYLEGSKPTCPSLITLYKLSKGLNISLRKIVSFKIKKN
jgi:transcriptional regulator with XRE-family HTH domain